MKLTWNGRWMNEGGQDEFIYRKGWWNYLNKKIIFPNSQTAQRVVQNSYDGNGEELANFITQRTDDIDSRKDVISNVCDDLRGAQGPYLDIGSMNGIITAGVAHELDITNVCGLDIHPVYHEDVLSIGYDENGNIGLESASVNLVTCLQLIHHIPDNELNLLIENIYRVTCGGAILYIKDHDYNGKIGFRKYLEAVHLYHQIANNEDFTLPIVYRSRDQILQMFSQYFIIPTTFSEPYGLQRIFSIKLCRKSWTLDGWDNQLFGNYILSTYSDFYQSFFSNDGIALDLFSQIIPELNTIPQNDDFIDCLRHWIETLLTVWAISPNNQLIGYRNGNLITVDETSRDYYLYGIYIS